jgi:dCMP deaminase
VRPTRDAWALGLAKLTAQRSTCLRRAVGCVLLNARGHVLATGYNGVAAGQPHCNEAKPDGWEMVPGTLLPGICLPTRLDHPHACPGAQAPSGTALDACHAIHAEANALLQCHDVWAIETAYVTASPCVHCIKLLLNTGCSRIVFEEEYPHPEAGKLWRDAGRSWQRYAEVT